MVFPRLHIDGIVARFKVEFVCDIDYPRRRRIVRSAVAQSARALPSPCEYPVIATGIVADGKTVISSRRHFGDRNMIEGDDGLPICIIPIRLCVIGYRVGYGVIRRTAV